MKYVYLFNEGNKNLKDLLGGKGANLSEMKNLGINVPDGFVVTTQAWQSFIQNSNELENQVIEQIINQIKLIEAKTEKTFGSGTNPLMFSVRSGAAISMPGMMDTVLNIGLNDITVTNFAKQIESEYVAYSCYYRLIQMFADVIHNVSDIHFKNIETNYMRSSSKSLLGFDTEDYLNMLNQYKSIYLEKVGEEFPQNVGVQLLCAVEAVFKSWNTPRAQSYRAVNKIDDNIGTAAVIQEMVFGNLNEQSATGVVFSRDPNTGKNELYGEVLIQAQGEDIVAGTATPLTIKELENIMPKIYNELNEIVRSLEIHFDDIQDVEFTVENGKLFILQTRNAKRSTKAKTAFLLEKYNTGKISENTFISQITEDDISAYIFPKFSEESKAKAQIFATGLPASSGAVNGVACFSLNSVKEAIKTNRTPILVRNETVANDFEAINLSDAVVTAIGGMTSHAAVVTRGMGKCCVCGVSSLKINDGSSVAISNNITLKEFDPISVNGTNGEIYLGHLDLEENQDNSELKNILEVIEKRQNMNVYVNADDAHGVERGINFGASGVGLVRTEHMFFDKERLAHMQALILSETLEERIIHLKKLSTYQIEDFKAILEVADDKPVYIRLLDPPFNEFLPNKISEAEDLAIKLGVPVNDLRDKIKLHKENNPMLGHRGARLAITYPEIYQMQVESAVTAVVLRKNEGRNSDVRIILPLISEINELKYLKQLIDKTVVKLLKGQDIDINIKLGVMIETPRAALISDSLAEYASFFSYGTNDLTQMTYGISRDDTASFMPSYFEKNIVTNDPFVKLDKLGVGKLLILSNQFGKLTNPDLVTGICGEHGGNSDSVKFAYNIGLDYVSCSPNRVPLAKLAVAKAVVEGGESFE